MAGLAIKALLLTIAVGASRALAASDEELRAAIEQLRTAIEAQQERIRSLQELGGELDDRELELKERRLLDNETDLAAPATPSIHGNQGGGFAGTFFRAYTDEENIEGALDHLWLLACGTLVMFMQCGFALVESGSVRFKNVQNVLLKNLTDVCIGTLGWFIFGYSFAFSGPLDSDGNLENGFAGTLQFAGHHFTKKRPDGQIEPVPNVSRDFFFQWAFCSASATIVSGGVAERVNFPGYAIFSFLMSSFIYPIVVAWTWGYGFLHTVNDVGVVDFAGSGIVHYTGGIGALVGAMIAGPRVGRWNKADGREQNTRERISKTPAEFNPHSVVLIVAGTFMLWFGWYGFNCGSTLEMHTMEIGMKAGQVAMNTTLAAATSGILVLIIKLDLSGKYDVGAMCNGILAGLVSITAGCSNMENAFAVLTGAIGALVFSAASTGLKAAKIDDPVDAFAVHGACGAWGVLAAALFDMGQGFDFVHGWNGFKCVTGDDGNCKPGLGFSLVLAAFAEIGMITVWAGGLCAIVFLVLKKLKFLVASKDIQDEGFDILKHSPIKAYETQVKELPKTTI